MNLIAHEDVSTKAAPGHVASRLETRRQRLRSADGRNEGDIRLEGVDSLQSHPDYHASHLVGFRLRVLAEIFVRQRPGWFPARAASVSVGHPSSTDERRKGSSPQPDTLFALRD